MVAALVTIVLIVVITHSKLGKGIQDIPNARSLHQIPVPRIGGLGVVAGLLTGWGLVWQPWLLPITAAVLFLMLISFLDDLYGLSAGKRFLLHFIASGVFVWAIRLPDFGWEQAVVLTIAIVWMTNLYNFMDGADGLAGGMALFGFGSYALVAWSVGSVEFFAMNACVAASAIAFLFFNFHPARIFMGDAGSIPLGFLAAAFGLVGWVKGFWPVWFPPLIFAPFIVDASTTLVKRAFSGEAVWQAHRSHYYQRLVLMGWGHKRTALAEYVLMVATGVTAIWMLNQSVNTQVLGLLIWGVIYIALMIWVDVAWLKHQKLQQTTISSEL